MGPNLPRLAYSFSCIERLDRHRWVEGITIASNGTRVGIRTDAAGLLDQFRPFFPPGWRESDKPAVRRLYSIVSGSKATRPGMRRYHILYMNASRIVRSLDLDDVIPRLESDMQLYIAERARNRVFLHAGVVAWHGKAIVLPGHSLAGKTTLVAELLRAGATYYSDEFAAIDPKGRVHPFPRSLSMRTGPTDDRPTRCSAESLGAPIGKVPLPVGLVVMTRYRPGSHWRPRRMTSGRAILALLENTVPARRRPQASLQALQRVVSDAPVLRGPRGEASETAEALLARVVSGERRAG